MLPVKSQRIEEFSLVVLAGATGLEPSSILEGNSGLEAAEDLFEGNAFTTLDSGLGFSSSWSSARAESSHILTA